MNSMSLRGSRSIILSFRPDAEEEVAAEVWKVLERSLPIAMPGPHSPVMIIAPAALNVSVPTDLAMEPTVARFFLPCREPHIFLFLTASR